MPLPTFFVIGAPRAGTTSLYQYLTLHPEIGMSRLKEPHFFADNIQPPVEQVADLAGYEALFTPDTAVRGEASPSYTCFAQHAGAPERISELVPDARFIYLVRDPVDRTVSHYLHRVSVENERRSLTEALGDVDDPANPYTCPSRYATQIERYLRYFPRDRLLVIDQSDLLVRRAELMRVVYSFLGVDADFTSAGFDEHLGASNDRRRYTTGYFRFLNRVTASPLRLLPPRSRRAMRTGLERVLFPRLEKPTLPDELRDRLVALYTPEMQRFREITSMSFDTWTV
jgi:hypothetical protein